MVLLVLAFLYILPTKLLLSVFYMSPLALQKMTALNAIKVI